MNILINIVAVTLMFVSAHFTFSLVMELATMLPEEYKRGDTAGFYAYLIWFFFMLPILLKVIWSSAKSLKKKLN